MKLRPALVAVLCAWVLSAHAADSIKDNWPTYNGDYTGRRFSGLTQITPQNAAHLGVSYAHARCTGRNADRGRRHHVLHWLQ